MDPMKKERAPSGLCECGCGQPTRRAPYTSARVGWVKGEWTRFVLGHNLRATPRYEVDAGTGCWNTLGGKTPGGYGKICENRRTYLLHRWMYERLFGPIPAGKQLHHLCRNKGCCNPAHLRVVTRKEHRALDSAKLTDADVREILLLASSRAITQVEIAKRFGIHPSHVGNILRGHRRAD
jgi:hypothetical protein